jgi:arginine deiminase
MFHGFFLIGDAIGLVTLILGISFPETFSWWMSIVIIFILFFISSYYVWKNKEHNPGLNELQKKIIKEYSKMIGDRRIMVLKTMGGKIVQNSALETINQEELVIALDDLVDRNILSKDDRKNNINYDIKQAGIDLINVMSKENK